MNKEPDWRNHARQAVLPNPGGRRDPEHQPLEIYELLSSDSLPSVHIDRTRLVRPQDLVAYVESLPKAG